MTSTRPPLPSPPPHSPPLLTHRTSITAQHADAWRKVLNAQVDLTTQLVPLTSEVNEEREDGRHMTPTVIGIGLHSRAATAILHPSQEAAAALTLEQRQKLQLEEDGHIQQDQLMPTTTKRGSMIQSKTVTPSSSSALTAAASSSLTSPSAASPALSSSPSSPNDNSEAYAALRHPPRQISSYLYKRGQTRKKWSTRWFTLQPNKFQLSYSHKKDHESHQHQEDEHRQINGIQYDEVIEEDEDEDDDETQVTKDSDAKVVTINLHRFRLDADPSGLQFTIILPASVHDSLEDGPSHDKSSSSSSAHHHSKEKHIELKAETKLICSEWLTELRRLQFQASYLQNYSTIISRNKVYALQGRHDLIQDPNPLGTPLPSSLMKTHFPAKQVSQMSLFTSALTGDSRTTCTRCHGNFGLLTAHIICVDCQQRFCTRPSCTMPHSYADEGVDTFSVLNITHTIKLPPPPRLCVECDRLRQIDPVYQKLLHGQLNLCLRILSGHDLTPANLLDGTSDPYVKFHVGSKEYQTPVIEGTLNPVWEREAEFNILWSDGSLDNSDAHHASKMPKTLCLEVWDKDRVGRDTFIGCIYLSVQDLEKNVMYDDYFPLRSKKEEHELTAEDHHDAHGEGDGAHHHGIKALGHSFEKMVSGNIDKLMAMGDNLHQLVSGKRKITGTLHLQVILTTASYTADLLKILPSLQDLSRHRANTSTPPKPHASQVKHHKSSLSEFFSHTPKSPTPPIPSPSPSPPSAPKQLSPIQQEINSFLKTSHLHTLLLRALDLVLSLHFQYWLDLWKSVMTYENPFVSIITFLLYTYLVFYFPSYGVLSAIPFILLLHLLSNLMDTSLRQGSAAIAAMIASEEARVQREAEDVAAEAAAEKLARKGPSLQHQLKGGLKNIGGFFKKGLKSLGHSSRDLGVTGGTNGAAGASSSANAAHPNLTVEPPSPSTSTLITTTAVTDPSTIPFESLASSSPETPSGKRPDTKDDKHSPSQSELEADRSAPVRDDAFVDGVNAVAAVATAFADPSPIAVPAVHLDHSHKHGHHGHGHGHHGRTHSHGGHPLDDEEHHGSIVFRMRKLKRQVKSVQYLLDMVMDMIEEMINIWQWKDIEKSQRFIRAAIICFFLTFYFNVRWLLFAMGAYKFSQHLLKLHRRIQTLEDQVHSTTAVNGQGRRMSKLRRH